MIEANAVAEATRDGVSDCGTPMVCGTCARWHPCDCGSCGVCEVSIREALSQAVESGGDGACAEAARLSVRREGDWCDGDWREYAG